MVVKQNPANKRKRECLLNFFRVSALYHYLKGFSQTVEIGFSFVKCCCHASTKINMIVFNHKGIKKPHPMIFSSPDPHSPFFSIAKIWSCFSGVQQLTVGVFYFLAEPVGKGSNATHSLKCIQYQSFCG